ncbi:MAG: N-acetyltransferase [Henriciella sp.]
MQAATLLKVDDAKCIADLHAEVFEPAGRWSRADFSDLLRLPSMLCLGSHQDGELSGVLLIQKAAPTAEILTLAILPTQQRCGIASHLLRAGLQILGQTGIETILLDVSEDNKGALGFYRHHAFTEDGRRKEYYRTSNGQRKDAILMSRPIAGQT